MTIKKSKRTYYEAVRVPHCRLGSELGIFYTYNHKDWYIMINGIHIFKTPMMMGASTLRGWQEATTVEGDKRYKWKKITRGRVAEYLFLLKL